MNRNQPFYAEPTDPSFDPWATPERLYLFEERAAIHQFDGGCSYAMAEALARGDARAVRFLDACGPATARQQSI